MLIGEYDLNGNVIAEYVYFGLRPVAVKNGSNINIVHTDYLTTPRIVTSGGSIVWQWRNDNPYGNNLAQGNIEFNLRFAGQYYDAESGLHYNIHRTYNPEIGRYMQSDPMGLSAGSNTYNYVGRNPFDAVDPLGLRGQSYAGNLDPVIVNVGKNVDVEDGWVTLVMHSGENKTSYNGALLLDKGSDLYNKIKDTPTFKKLLLPREYIEKEKYGDVQRYGVSGETMGNMLLEAGIINEKTKGITIQSCNAGLITHNEKLIAQTISDITRKIVKAPHAYVYFNNGKVVGSYGPLGVFAYKYLSINGGLYANIFPNALNVMETFAPH